MITNTKNSYKPDYVLPPGDSLQDIIESKNMSQAELAQRTGRPKKTINEIVKGKCQITPATALQLEKVLKIPASFWINRESQYQSFLAKEEEKKEFAKHVDWLSKFPVADMIKKGWIEKYQNKVQQLETLLEFFGIANPNQWDELWLKSVVFRKSRAFQGNPYAISAWLRKGEIEANKMSCGAYDEKKFLSALNSVRSRPTRAPSKFIPEIKSICSESGVAVVFVPEIKGTCLYGATRWIESKKKALLQLSVRDKSDDRLWFTLFHEAAHIIIHGKTAGFIDDRKSNNEIEEEADSFASEKLIPEKLYKKFIKAKRFNNSTVIKFAHEIGLAPGIIVGRLQHDRLIEFSNLNKLKNRYKWE